MIQSGVGEEMGLLGLKRIKSHKGQKREDTCLSLLFEGNQHFLWHGALQGNYQTLSVLFNAWELRPGSGSLVLMPGHFWGDPRLGYVDTQAKGTRSSTEHVQEGSARAACEQTALPSH